MPPNGTHHEASNGIPADFDAHRIEDEVPRQAPLVM
jgi:hypothetical protein